MTDEIARYGLLAIFVLMLLESACIPIPSEVTMLFGGAPTTASFLAPEQQLDFWLQSSRGRSATSSAPGSPTGPATRAGPLSTDGAATC